MSDWIEPAMLLVGTILFAASFIAFGYTTNPKENPPE